MTTSTPSTMAPMAICTTHCVACEDGVMDVSGVISICWAMAGWAFDRIAADDAATTDPSTVAIRRTRIARILSAAFRATGPRNRLDSVEM
jgi:hypothetical protein